MVSHPSVAVHNARGARDAPTIGAPQASAEGDQSPARTPMARCGAPASVQQPGRPLLQNDLFGGQIIGADVDVEIGTVGADEPDRRPLLLDSNGRGGQVQGPQI